jgi:hypothetical protein
MKYVISRYNHDLTWINDYTNDYTLYDRSDLPLDNSIVVPNIGSDIHDKLSFIIDNYYNLPDIAVYAKANLFKYITKEEFEIVKDNKTFTPLLTKHHKVYEPICRYNGEIYEEINNGWYLASHPPKNELAARELFQLLNLDKRPYIQFAPGSNYILPKENILKHSKAFYEKLRSYLDWTVYPGEAQIMERGLYYLWQ